MHNYVLLKNKVIYFQRLCIINVFHIGTGPETVIFIHGFPTSSFDYKRVVKNVVDAGFKVVMYDHIGFGFSDKPNEVTISLNNLRLSCRVNAENCIFLYSSN